MYMNYYITFTTATTNQVLAAWCAARTELSTSSTYLQLL